MFCPAVAMVGPPLVIVRSVCGPTAVVADEVLSAVFGSLMLDEALAVLVTLVPAKFAGML